VWWGGCGRQVVREVGQWAGMVVGGWCWVREWGGGGSWAEGVSGVFSRYRKIKN
jgi:hypothetical protein